MKEWSMMGKNCRDIVSGFEGICNGVVEWMFDSKQYIIQPKSPDPSRRVLANQFYEKQLEIVDDGIVPKVEVPAYQEPIFFGKLCRDKVTGMQGVCIGRVVWLFSCPQYILEIQPDNPAMESRVVWLDEGRVEVDDKKEWIADCHRS